MMSDKTNWTRELDDVFLAQQQGVLNAVQRLRQRADTAGHLKSTAQQKVTRTTLPLLRLRRQISAAPLQSSDRGHGEWSSNEALDPLAAWAQHSPSI